MAKTFNSFEKAAIKNAAKAIASIKIKQEKIKKTIEEFESKLTEYDAEIKVFEDSVSVITGGYKPQELVIKVERESGKQADWVFIHPETILPENETETVAEEPQQEEPVVKEEPQEDPFSEEPTEDDVVDTSEDPMDELFD